MTDTIYALASGTGRAGVGVVRISGDNSYAVAQKLGVDNLSPRILSMATLLNFKSKKLIDQSMAVYFPAPNSFTGEDVIELHIHGSRAVLNTLFFAMEEVGKELNCVVRLAEPGEFSKRAFENDKMDLTQAEGLIDLINAETEAQMRQAQRQASGALKDLYHGWADTITPLLAHYEAYIDFPDEDLSIDVQNKADEKLFNLFTQINNHLADNNSGERIRDGVQVAVVGEPNAGKSSLVNSLAKRNVAIVSDIAGTTRDIIEVSLDIGGYPVRLFDTAGIRKSNNEIELEGIKRAVQSANDADIILLVVDGTKDVVDSDYIKQSLKTISNTDTPVVVLANKCEKSDFKAHKSLDNVFDISALGEDTLTSFLAYLQEVVLDQFDRGLDPVITRSRHRQSLQECVDCLVRAKDAPVPELVAEDLRMAMRAIGRITGQVDVEELLDIVFRDFCIGK